MHLSVQNFKRVRSITILHQKLFGNVFGVDQELGLAIQFSPIEAEQKEQLFRNEKLSNNIKTL